MSIHLLPLRQLLQGLFVGVLFLSPTTFAANEATLVACARFDFETGTDDQHPPNVSYEIWYDVVFCGGGENEYLRALPRVSWVDMPMRNFALDKNYMAKAQYTSRTNPLTGYPDLFFNAASASNSRLGEVYWIKTAEGKLVKLRIKNFVPFQKQRGIARNMVIEYVIFL